MKKKPAALTIALLALSLLATCLAACTITDAQALDPESTSIPESTSASLEPASSSSTASSRPVSSPGSSRPASSSKPVAPSSSSPLASSSSKPAATQAASSSQSPATTPATPAPQSSAPPQPQPQPAPQPAPQPNPPPQPAPPVQNADAGACIAWGHAYADGLNLAVNDGLAIGAAGFENPIETAGKTDAAVQEHLQHQLNGILNMWKSIPEYDPNIKVPCYKLVLSGSQIYVLYG